MSVFVLFDPLLALFTYDTFASYLSIDLEIKSTFNPSITGHVLLDVRLPFNRIHSLEAFVVCLFSILVSTNI